MTKKRKKPPKQPDLVAEKKRSSTEDRRKAIFRGFLRYVQRPGATIRDVWESERIGEDEEAPYIKDVYPLATFKNAAMSGKWRTRRDEHWLEVKRRVMTHIQSDAVKAEIEEIGTLEAMKQVVFGRIVGDKANDILPAEPKSLEGAIGAFVQLDKRISQKRDVIVVHTAASAANVDQKIAFGEEQEQLIALPDNPLSDVEVEAMARALARERAGLEAEQSEPIEIPSVISAREDDDNGKSKSIPELHTPTEPDRA